MATTTPVETATATKETTVATNTATSVPEKPRPGEQRRTDILVIVIVAVALVLGWALMESVAGRTAAFADAGGAFSLRYPASWVVARPAAGVALAVYDRRSSEDASTGLTVYTQPLRQGAQLVDVATAWTLGRARDLREFHDLGTEQTTLNGQPALQVSYAYVSDPAAGLGPAAVPVVVQGTDTIVILGNQALIFSAVGDARQDELDPRLSAILASVKLSGR